MERNVVSLMRSRWGAAACAFLLSVLSPLGAHAAFNATLQGLNAGSTTWIDGNLMGWRELDYIPCRVYITGGPANNKTITVEFDHIRGTIRGVENLTGWTPSPNVVIMSAPVLSAPIGAATWSYTFKVNVTDNNPGFVEFRARLSAGAHLNVGSSLALRGSPSLGSLQIHKPEPGAGFPDLALVKRGPVNAAPGETLTYTINYTNKLTTTNVSVGVQITDILPSELDVVTNSLTQGGFIVGNSLIWDLGNLVPGAIGTRTYRATVKAGTAYGTSFQNYAQILSSENDGNPADNVSSVTTLVTFNRAPVANDDTYSVNEDAVLNVSAPGVLANDTDADGNPLTVATPRPVTSPANGALVFNANGSFIYTPSANFNGTDGFTYHVTDGSATSAVAVVTITVKPLRDAPVAANDIYSTDEDTMLNVATPGILANDNDPDGDILSAGLVTGTTHGVIALNSDGSFAYTPAPDYFGPDSFTYRANDGDEDSDVATVRINVRPLSDPPRAVNDTYATDEDTALNIATPGVLANDSDPDGAMLTAVLATGPTHGTLALNLDGSFLYTPTSNYTGPDTFTYRAGAGPRQSGIATVVIMVRPLSDAPVAVDDSYATDEDTALNISKPGVLANDTDADGDALTAALVAGPTHGTLTLNASGSFLYTPAANYNGPDSFTYRASDGTLQSGIATVSITVRPFSDPPVAANDAYATDEDTVLAIAAPGVLANDSDADGNPLTAALVSGPTRGVLSLNANGSFTYTPQTNFSGSDSFTYRVNDGSLDSAPATVGITVRPISDAPIAANDSYATDEDTALNITAPGVLANDSDADGNTLTAMLVAGPAHGTLTLNANGSFLYTPTANYTGPDSFTYRASDGTLQSGIATASITVRPINDPPVAANDAYATDEDMVLTISAPGVLANDSDPDGNPLTAAVVTGPAHGTLNLLGNGSFVYTPTANYAGPDAFTYRASDGTAQSGIATVNITVRPISDAPIAANDTYATDEDTALNTSAPGVLANDSDADGESLTATLVTGPAHGTVTLNANGSFLYTPTANYNGPDTFTYKANDGATDSALATVNITVRPISDAPVAVNDAYATDEDTALTISAPGVLANDSDADGNALTAALVAGPAHGALTLNPNGSFTYTPAANYTGPDAFTYKANDGSADSGIATVSITVRPTSDAPIAANDAYTTDEDTALNVSAPGVVANDSDADGDTLTAILVSPPQHGTLTLNANGSFLYAPAANYTGADSFTYRASDGVSNSAIATVSLTVRPVNDAPVAVGDSYATDEDIALSISAPGVLANDSDPDGNTLSAIRVTGPLHGTVTLNSDGSFLYTPAANYYGPDSFTYKANDGVADSGIATVNITVRPVNDPPVAVNDAFATDEDVALTVSAHGVLANDSDADTNALTAALVTGPAHGTLALNANGSFVYTPAANYVGPDSFTYKANDGAADSAIATVSLTVRPVNDPPVAVNDAYTTTEDTALNISAPGILANDSDTDANPLTAVLVTGPAHGTLTLNPNGSFAYTPAANYNGPDNFAYRANDGTTSSAPAMVNITVQPANDAPVANNDSYSTEEDTPLTVSAPGVLANDTDNDGDALTALLVVGPAHGTLALNANGSFTYTPALDYNGADSFTYRASDGTAQSGIATVSITIGGFNDPPVANNDSYSTDEDVALTIAAPGVLANDTDAEGSTLIAVLVASPSHGTLTLNASGSFTYTPALNYNGPDSFTYKASDGAKDSGVATASIMVVPRNDPPVANNDAYATDEDTALTIASPGVLANDSDAENTPLTAAIVSQPAHGTVMLNANGSFLYTPAANYTGSDSFTYRVSDGATNSAAATVTITVRPLNDAPVALNDSYTTDEDTTLVISAPGVLTNDTDPEGTALAAILVAGPSQGTLLLNAGGSFNYRPATNYTGADSFTYKVSDGMAESGMATVSLTVRPAADTPVANNDSYSTGEDQPLTVSAPGVLANDFDGDGDPLTAMLVGNPANGSLTLNASGSFTYTPNADYNGTDSFTYRASDGGLNSGIATVTIQVIPQPDPRLTADDDYTTLEDTTLTVAAPGVLANDISVDGDTLFALLVQGPAHGSVTLLPAGRIVYVPEPDFSGIDSFLYRAAELDSASMTSRVTIIVRPVNDAPSFTKGANHFARLSAGLQTLANWARNLRSGPADEAGQALTFLVTHDQPSLFSVQPAISPDGHLTYTPASGASGQATVTVRLQDDGGTADGGIDTSAPQTFVIGVNAPPVANILVPTNGSVFIAAANIGIIAGASDPDGQVTKVEIFQDATKLFDTGLAPYEFGWTNVATGEYVLRARATDDMGATGDSAPVNVTVLQRPPLTIVEAMRLNLQSGLFEQRVRVFNPTPFDLEAVRVLVTDLLPTVSVYNRSGLTNEIPYVQYNLPVPAGGSVDLIIEYYVPNRVPPNPTLLAEVVRSASPFGDVPGEMQTITRQVRLANGMFMIEWNSQRHRTYFIQYSEDLKNWKTVVPAAIGTGTRQQWIDNGPPKTDSPPGERPCRFYRIILTP